MVCTNSAGHPAAPLSPRVLSRLVVRMSKPMMPCLTAKKITVRIARAFTRRPGVNRVSCHVVRAGFLLLSLGHCLNGEARSVAFRSPGWIRGDFYCLPCVFRVCVSLRNLFENSLRKK